MSEPGCRSWTGCPRACLGLCRRPQRLHADLVLILSGDLRQAVRHVNSAILIHPSVQIRSRREGRLKDKQQQETFKMSSVEHSSRLVAANKSYRQFLTQAAKTGRSQKTNFGIMRGGSGEPPGLEKRKLPCDLWFCDFEWDCRQGPQRHALPSGKSLLAIRRRGRLPGHVDGQGSTQTMPCRVCAAAGAIVATTNTSSTAVSFQSGRFEPEK